MAEKCYTDHAPELRQLGFPEEIIQSVERIHEAGLCNYRPRPEFIQETLNRCSRLLVQDLAEKPCERQGKRHRFLFYKMGFCESEVEVIGARCAPCRARYALLVDDVAGFKS